jgi:hypothetical protein
MKRCFVFSLFLISTHSFAQQISGMFIDLGAGSISIKKTGFDKWTNQNYGKTVRPPGAIINLDLNIYVNHWNGGCEPSISLTQHVETADFFFGRLITPEKTAFKSFVDAQIGGYYQFVYHIAPLNYSPPSSYQGKNLNLEGGGTYIGLSSRSFWFKKPKDPEKPGLSFELAVEENYLLWPWTWNYGYTKSSGKYSHRYSQKIYDIPRIEKQFFTAITLSIGFGGEFGASKTK